MKKLSKNEKICIDCGAIIRIKNNRQKRCKSCNKKRNIENAFKRNKKVRSIGTPATWNLSSNAIKRQLYLIRNNIDKNNNLFISDKSKRDVILDSMAYDENYTIILEV